MMLFTAKTHPDSYFWQAVLGVRSYPFWICQPVAQSCDDVWYFREQLLCEEKTAIRQHASWNNRINRVT
jgi:hypothetical protein